MELNKKYEIGLNKYIEPISVVFEKGNGFCVFNCNVHRSEGRVTNADYHSLHILELLKRYEKSKTSPKKDR